MQSRKLTKKNVSLIPYEKDGIPSFKLLGANGEILSFTVFSNSLLRQPFNSLRKYCFHLADFFDFLIEATFHILAEDESKTIISKSDLKEVIANWDEYMVLGSASEQRLAKLVASTLPRNLLADSTSKGKRAVLKQFLMLSESVRTESIELASIGMTSIQFELDESPLFGDINRLVEVSGKERIARLRNSMLAGAVHARKAPTRSADLFGKTGKVPYDPKKAFPLQMAHSFIQLLPTYRDKSIACLIAAAGHRPIEGLQLLTEDVHIDLHDPTKSCVRLINPESRRNHPSYLALSPAQRKRLAWKGRETDRVFMIEPFRTMFFENLQQYLSHEYYPHNRHSFLFQILRAGVTRGNPYFLTAASTRQQIFKTAAKKAGVPSEASGMRSFRHAYGTYLLNYFPVGKGRYGIPMGLVRVMMGHKAISSTQKYAIHDTDLIDEHLQLANVLLYSEGNVRSFVDQKLDAMRARMNEFEQFSKNFLPVLES